MLLIARFQKSFFHRNKVVLGYMKNLCVSFGQKDPEFRISFRQRFMGGGASANEGRVKMNGRSNFRCQTEYFLGLNPTSKNPWVSSACLMRRCVDNDIKQTFSTLKCGVHLVRNSESKRPILVTKRIKMISNINYFPL